mmetsp:Transcript_30157/g.56949  ORF Transcript_30157/g.56949 Transcript_30157/m.56949 type:complete len:237 (+) Transcript_30157:800-1510(+)
MLDCRSIAKEVLARKAAALVRTRLFFCMLAPARAAVAAPKNPFLRLDSVERRPTLPNAVSQSAFSFFLWGHRNAYRTKDWFLDAARARSRRTWLGFFIPPAFALPASSSSSSAHGLNTPSSSSSKPSFSLPSSSSSPSPGITASVSVSGWSRTLILELPLASIPYVATVVASSPNPSHSSSTEYPWVDTSTINVVASFSTSRTVQGKLAGNSRHKIFLSSKSEKSQFPMPSTFSEV